MSEPEPESQQRSGPTRRSFLAGANALVLLALLEGCTSDHPSKDRGDVIAELRRAVQASPDHLHTVASRAVATKDPARIAAFVRDQVTVLPPWDQGADAISTRRWGSAATLRGGAGSLRDRAELLAELLAAAGIGATVKQATRPADVDLAALYELKAARFTPDAELLKRATALLPKSSKPQSTSTSATASAAQAAARAIKAAIPAAQRTATRRTDLLPDAVPVVEIVTSSGTRWAYALGRSGLLVSPPPGLDTAAAREATPDVAITISALTRPAPGSSHAPGDLVDLVTGRWSAEQLFGHQVLLNFVPVNGPEGYLTSAPEDQPVRVPMLRVQYTPPAFAVPGLPATLAAHPAASSPSTLTPTSPPPPPTVPAAAPVIGAPVTVQGEVLPALADPAAAATPGPAAGPLGPILTLSADQQKAAAATASTMAATVNAGPFPEVELDVAVLDAAGNSVSGLGADAFTVAEDGAAVPWLQLLANSTNPTAPRVLVAYDASGSVEDLWSSPAVKAAFEQRLAQTLVTAGQSAPYELQVLGLGQATTPGRDSWIAPEQGKIVAALQNADFYSDVWGTLAGTAIDQGVVAIIMVSDFVSTEDATKVAADQRRLAASGVPVFCLPIGKPDEAALASVLTLSRGTRLDPNADTTADRLAALIAPLVATRAKNCYRLRYAAPVAGPATRTVTVHLHDHTSVQATATYTRPATTSAPWSFVGLYARIDIAGYSAQQRHLAGLALDRSGSPMGALDDPEAVKETRQAIFGLTTIAIEPGTVTTAALTDDVLAAMQSLQPLAKLPRSTTADQLLDAAGDKGVSRIPGVLISLLQQPDDIARPVGVLPAMRVAVLQEQAVGNGRLANHLDLVPALNRVEPVGSDPRAAFDAAIDWTTRAAAAEGAAFVTSAFGRLAGRELQFFAASQFPPRSAFAATVPKAKQASWQALMYVYLEQHVLVPKAGVVDAFWVIDPATGAVSAVLLDGSGGAHMETQCGTLDQGDKTLFVLNALMTSWGVVCMFIQPFFCVGHATKIIFIVASGVLLAVSIGKGGTLSLSGILGLGLGTSNTGLSAGNVGMAILAVAVLLLSSLPEPCPPAPSGSEPNACYDNGTCHGD